MRSDTRIILGEIELDGVELVEWFLLDLVRVVQSAWVGEKESQASLIQEGNQTS